MTATFVKGNSQYLGSLLPELLQAFLSRQIGRCFRFQNQDDAVQMGRNWTIPDLTDRRQVDQDQIKFGVNVFEQSIVITFRSEQIAKTDLGWSSGQN